jgi:hypothetical protein
VLVGRRVIKKFTGYGMHAGVVMAHLPNEQTHGAFLIHYDDGDTEHMPATQLGRWLQPSTQSLPQEGASRLRTRQLDVVAAVASSPSSPSGVYCSICMSDFAELPPVTPVLQLPRCEHFFCQKCIEGWFSTSAANSCPACRVVYPSSRRCVVSTAGAVVRKAGHHHCEASKNLHKSKVGGSVRKASRQYEVEAILAERQTRGETEFQVKWRGYPVAESTWEPEKHLAGSRALVQDFCRTALAVSDRDPKRHRPFDWKKPTAAPARADVNAVASKEVGRGGRPRGAKTKRGAGHASHSAKGRNSRPRQARVKAAVAEWVAKDLERRERSDCAATVAAGEFFRAAEQVACPQCERQMKAPQSAFTLRCAECAFKITPAAVREIAEALALCEGHDHSSHTAAEAGNVTESTESSDSDTESDCGKASIVEPVRKAQKCGRRRNFGQALRAGKPVPMKTLARLTCSTKGERRANRVRTSQGLNKANRRIS